MTPETTTATEAVETTTKEVRKHSIKRSIRACYNALSKEQKAARIRAIRDGEERRLKKTGISR